MNQNLINSVEIFAFCVFDEGQEYVKKHRTYKVVELWQSDILFPFGVVLDKFPKRSFFVQRFAFFEHNLN